MSPGFKSIENSPSKSVVVPMVVPFTSTVAPGSGFPFSSSTFPLIGAINSELFKSRIGLITVILLFTTLNSVPVSSDKV